MRPPSIPNARVLHILATGLLAAVLGSQPGLAAAAPPADTLAEGLKQCDQGQYGLAVETLREAYRQNPDGEAHLQAAGALGLAYLQLRQPAAAQPLLREAYEGAADPRQQARHGLDLANLEASLKHTAAAQRLYDAVARLAPEDTALQASVALNRIPLAAPEQRLALLVAAQALTEALPTPRERAAFSLNLGMQATAAGKGAEAGRLAHSAFTQALAAAQVAGGGRLRAATLNQLAQLYENDHRSAEALLLTVQGIQSAQAPDARDLLVPLEWRRGRLLSAEGRTGAAIDALQRAVDEIEAVRQDIPIEYENGRSSFRDTLEPVYLGLADLLLRQSAQLDPAAQQAQLLRVRDTLETIKQTELEDFLGSRCAVEGSRRAATGAPRPAGRPAGGVDPAERVGSAGSAGSTSLAGSRGSASSASSASLAGSEGSAGSAGSAVLTGLAGSAGPAGSAGLAGSPAMAARSSAAGTARSPALAKGTAVLYPVILPDRLELLVETRAGISRHTVAVTATALRRDAAAFAAALRSRRPAMDLAQRLYRALLLPAAPVLAREAIDTLVVVPDGVLRLVPFGALHDGERYAVERFAFVVVPAVTLPDKPAEAPAPRPVRLLLAGVSQPGSVVEKLPPWIAASLLSEPTGGAAGGSGEARSAEARAMVARDLTTRNIVVAETDAGANDPTQDKPAPSSATAAAGVGNGVGVGGTNTSTSTGDSADKAARRRALQERLALAGVATEIDAIARLAPSTTLLNQDFSVRSFSEQVASGRFGVVHIASHGVFGATADATFLMAHDDLITIDQLQALLRGPALREHPVELLTLSACETAEGDDRAPLGLSGAALKAQAQSALGSLWPVSDDAAQSLMGDFYGTLAREGLRSRAKALQAAQIRMIGQPSLQQPFFWAPFILVERRL